MDTDFGQAFGAIHSFFTRARFSFYRGLNQSEERLIKSLEGTQYHLNPEYSVEENILQFALVKANFGGVMREDASVFLLSNIKYMFVLPAKRVYFIYKRRSSDDFAKAISMIIDDVALVVQRAEELSGPRRLVAADVMRATTEQWQDLSTNKDGRFWGGRDD